MVKIINEKHSDQFYFAFSKSSVAKRNLPGGIWEEKILKSYYPGRSGDVVAVQKPFKLFGGTPGNHQTSFAYDSTVPILFSGFGIKKGRYSNARVVDIAPTLSRILGVLPPALNEGKVLAEILKN